MYLYPWHHLAQTHCDLLEALSFHQVNNVEVFLVWDFFKCTDAKNPGRKEKGLFQWACYCVVTNQHRLWLEKRIRKLPSTHTCTYTQCSWCSSSKSQPAMTELGLKKNWWISLTSSRGSTYVTFSAFFKPVINELYLSVQHFVPFIYTRLPQQGFVFMLVWNDIKLGWPDVPKSKLLSRVRP